MRSTLHSSPLLPPLGDDLDGDERRSRVRWDRRRGELFSRPRLTGAFFALWFALALAVQAVFG